MDIRKLPVYVIALKAERIHKLSMTLHEYGFEDVRFTEGVQDRKKVLGVAKAHMNALKKALRECGGPFIILEEDVLINSKEMEIYIPPDADAIYLGISSWVLKNGKGENNMVCAERFNGGLYRIFNMLAAHAVLYLNRDYAEFLASSIPIFISMQTNQDKLRAETMKFWNVYALNSPIFYQSHRYEPSTRFKISEKQNQPLSFFYR